MCIRDSSRIAGAGGSAALYMTAVDDTATEEASNETSTTEEVTEELVATEQPSEETIKEEPAAETIEEEPATETIEEEPAAETIEETPSEERIEEAPPADEVPSSEKSAEEEENKLIAQSNINVDKTGKILDSKVIARQEGDFPVVDSSSINYTDVAPNQIASISASLIPFLEHDDANRALMGSNMQRQAVPVLRAEKPLVGTGLETVVARDSGVCIVAKNSGVVESVDASRICLLYTSDAADE